MDDYEEFVRIRDAFAKLTPAQRELIMQDYCHDCFTADPRCQCWNDE